MSLLTITFPEGKERNHALGVLGSMSATSFLIGLILGGILTSTLDWRWVFFINIPIGSTME
jgi:MFS family permease